MNLKPLATEKAVKMIDLDNTLVFSTDRKNRKEEIRAEIEEVFKVKVEKLRVQVKDNKKIVYVKLKKEFPAIDLATKIGMM